MMERVVRGAGRYSKGNKKERIERNGGMKETVNEGLG